jgi:hypothetical protein
VIPRFSIRALIKPEHIELAWNTIVSLASSPDDKVAIKACQEILDRACGKPVQAIEGSGMGPAILLQLLTGKAAEKAESDPWD